jgi:hypothetical protein
MRGWNDAAGMEAGVKQRLDVCALELAHRRPVGTPESHRVHPLI